MTALKNDGVPVSVSDFYDLRVTNRHEETGGKAFLHVCSLPFASEAQRESRGAASRPGKFKLLQIVSR